MLVVRGVVKSISQGLVEISFGDGPSVFLPLAEVVGAVSAQGAKPGDRVFVPDLGAELRVVWTDGEFLWLADRNGQRYTRPIDRVSLVGVIDVGGA